MFEERISVIVPCFNEEKSIYQNLLKIFSYLGSRFRIFEIIAVNDGSTDQTQNELQKFQKINPLKIINNHVNRGKGQAVKDGMMSGQYEILMFLDADLAIPIEELEKFLTELKNGYDIVIASRSVPGVKIVTPVLWYRRIMEEIFRVLRLIILSDYDVKDTQCGFKIFRQKAALTIFPLMTIKRFAFDAEIIFLAKKFGFKIKELPISLQNPPESHIRLSNDPPNMFFALLKIRFNDILGKYNHAA